MGTVRQIKNLATKTSTKTTAKAQNVVIVKNQDGEIDLNNTSKMPRRIQAILDNSDGTSTKTSRIFDVAKIIESLVGQVDGKTKYSPVKGDAIRAYLQSRTLHIDKIRMEVTKSPEQFSNKATVYEGNVEGVITTQPLYLADAVDSGDYNPKIQTYKTDLKVDYGTAIDINVNAGEKLIITFYIADVTTK
jgi:hypothetical protein